MIVGFTGTRLGLTPYQLQELQIILQQLKPSEFHHGDCIGADNEAHMIAQSLGIRIVIHPPDLRGSRAFCKGFMRSEAPLPFLERNKAIVEAAELVIACPESPNERLRSGTWSTVRYARKRGKPVHIIVEGYEG